MPDHGYTREQPIQSNNAEILLSIDIQMSLREQVDMEGKIWSV